MCAVRECVCVCVCVCMCVCVCVCQNEGKVMFQMVIHYYSAKVKVTYTHCIYVLAIAHINILKEARVCGERKQIAIALWVK